MEYDNFEFDEEEEDTELTGESSSVFDLPRFHHEQQQSHVDTARNNCNVNKAPTKIHDRCIVHIDIDCFYAQVEMNENPSLRHKPMGVRQKDLVITTNYVARNAGVPKHCWVHEARKVRPDLVLVNGEDLYKYRKVSKRIFEFLTKTYQCPVERLGMDENFLDVTSIVQKRLSSSKPLQGHKNLDSGVDSKNDFPQVHGHSFLSSDNSMNPFETQGYGCLLSNYAENFVQVQGHSYMNSANETSCKCGCDSMLKAGSEIAKEIRDGLYAEFSITTSAGIAHNKTLAKMIGSQHKPNKQTTIFPSDVEHFMLEHDNVKAIPGIGSSLSKLMENQKGIHSVRDLQNTSVEELKTFLDEAVAKRVHELSLGIDNSAVKMSLPPKSIGLEDRVKQISTKAECVQKLEWLLDRICVLLYEDGRLPRVLKVTVRDYFKDKTLKKFHKESRQCKINPSLFKSLAHSSKLDVKCRKEVLNIAVTLLRKMVTVEGDFHLTLIGLSCGDFIDEKHSISTFFATREADTTITNCRASDITATNSSSTSCPKTQAEQEGRRLLVDVQISPSKGIESFFAKNPAKTSATSHNSQKNKRFLNPNSCTENTENVAKKVKFTTDDHTDLSNYGKKAETTHLSPAGGKFERSIALHSATNRSETASASSICNDGKPGSFFSTPDSKSNNHDLFHQQRELPKGWDLDVFLELPVEIRNELLREHSTENSKSKHQPKKESIKNYFFKM